MCNEKELIDIRSLNLIELTDFVVDELGEKKFRAKQLYEWMHQHLAQDYDEMKNIQKSLKEKLEKVCTYRPLKKVDIKFPKSKAPASTFSNWKTAKWWKAYG